MSSTALPLTPQLEIDSLMRAVRWPAPAQRAVLVLATQLLTSGRHRDGYGYFDERSRAVPENVLFQTLAGMFQARLGEDVDGALAKLDDAAERDLGLPHYYRGITLAALPDCAGRPETVVADLEFVLAVENRFPPGFLRPVYRALATAYEALGRLDEAKDAAGRSGPLDMPPLVADYWGSARDGFHLVPPRLTEAAHGVHLAQGFDFSDIVFVVTADSVVAIDSGSNERSARAALKAFRDVTDLPISHVILTHAHWDHTGGVGVFAGPGTEVIAQSGFPEELALQNRSPAPFPYFLAGEPHRQEVVPDRLVSTPEALTIGGTRFGLLPIAGGETHDGLLVHLPERGVVCTGDMIMPQLGAPFFPEGSAPGLFDAMETVLALEPELLIHGHAGLTDNFTIATFPALLTALRELYDLVLADIADSRPLVHTLRRAHLPEVLRDSPYAVTPFLVLRDNVIERVHRQHTGYWSPDGDGVERFAPGEWAAALDLLAGGSAEAWVNAGTELLGRGDATLALQVIEYGRASHPGHPALEELRTRALHEIIARSQMLTPFKFVYYAGLADLDLPPVE